MVENIMVEITYNGIQIRKAKVNKTKIIPILVNETLTYNGIQIRKVKTIGDNQERRVVEHAHKYHGIKMTMNFLPDPFIPIIDIVGTDGDAKPSEVEADKEFSLKHHTHESFDKTKLSLGLHFLIGNSMKSHMHLDSVVEYHTLAKLIIETADLHNPIFEDPFE